MRRISKNSNEYQVLIGGPFDDFKEKDDKNILYPLVESPKGVLPMLFGAYIYSHSEDI